MNERQQYHYNTNLPIWSVAIETKVLVALVEHVSVSVLEINNLRYGLCQAGAWGASDCYSYVCVNLTMLKSWTVEYLDFVMNR